MLSQKTKYALRALLMLAREEGKGPILISDIAEQERVPRKFLEAILLELKRHGLVHSRRGKNGGYSLAKPARQVTFGQVIRIIDGPMAPLPCLSRTAYRRCEDCLDEKACRLRGVLGLAHQATTRVLDKTSLHDAVCGAGVDLVDGMGI